MLRALFAGVSGLRNHLFRMDVIGNNIANVNTVGYKASRVTFREGFAQILAGASAPGTMIGGSNPSQIGTGVQLGSIDPLFTQGAFETTGQPFDMAIQGDAFFIVNLQGRVGYTRAGNLQLDASGRLTLPGTGWILQGLNADALGNLPASGLEEIVLPINERSPARATSEVQLEGNLDASAATGTTHTVGVTVYDAVGTAYNLRLTFTKEDQGWSWSAECDGATVAPRANGAVAFNPDGSLENFIYPEGAGSLTITPDAGEPFSIALDAGDVGGTDGLTSYAAGSDATSAGQNGQPSGDLVQVRVDGQGIITGIYNNGTTRTLAQVALASFTNPNGLFRLGDNVYEESANSGTAVVGYAGTSQSSTIASGMLESSNVDIAEEFTNMIITQRGFQANARVITAADEMLTELVNLKR